MTPVGVMVGSAVSSWVIASMAAGPELGTEVLLGMLGPLVLAVVSWELASRTYRRTPERLTRLMVAAFAGKMVFFAAYVTVALLGLSVRPVPFVVSLTSYFIGLHLIEALSLRRLFVEAASR